MRLLHFRAFEKRIQKRLLPGRIMFRCADQNKETGLESQLVCIQLHHLVSDDPRIPHFADAIPNRRLGRADFLGNFIQRAACIRLQGTKNFPIRVVDTCHGFPIP